MALVGGSDDITIELPLSERSRFSDGQRLGAELRRLADAEASGRGRQIVARTSVSTDNERGVYVATFSSQEANG